MESNTIYFSDNYLSQFYMLQITVNIERRPILFNCNEQYYQYSKAIYFKDYNIARQILLSQLPKVQKRLGQNVNGFDKEEWDKVKYDICLIGNRAKFNQNEYIRNLLVSTGSNVIAEARKDNIWGIGLNMNEAHSSKEWKGQNLLGKVLMQVRSEIDNSKP